MRLRIREWMYAYQCPLALVNDQYDIPYLRCLDMVMEVVPEGLYVGDNFVSPLAGQMPREKHCSRISLLLSLALQ